MRHSTHLLRTIQPVNDSLLSGFLGWWKFNEGSGTTCADSSTNNNPLTLSHNNNSGNSWVSPGHNSSNSALWLRATVGGNYNGARNEAPTGLNIGTSAFTVSMWVKDSSNVYYCFSVGSASAGIAIHTHGFAYGHPGFNINNPTSQSAEYFNGTINAGWTHFVVTKEAGATHKQANSYINNVYCSNLGNSGGNTQVNIDGTNVIIGSLYMAGAYNFDAAIDDVRFYNRVLTAAEVNTLYTTT